jgi:glycolate oxidase iron-sulfur subunit
MQTHLPADVLATPGGRRADEILRACVHCGFCNATCPTYRELGDELDGPRGRIYLIKELLEHDAGHATVETHLDRCLTCRACETTCPSGVAYGELLEIGRETLESRHRRGWVDRMLRAALLLVIPRPRLFAALTRLGRALRWAVPRPFRDLMPARVKRDRFHADPEASVRVVVLQGCVQRTATPNTNTALARLLAHNGVGVTKATDEVCCGGLALHLGAADAARDTMRRNVRALYAAAQDGARIVSTASGCGVTVKDYGRLLGDDAEWRDRAGWVADHTLDVAELVARDVQSLGRDPRFRRVAWQAPCTLQHGQAVRGAVEAVLTRAGYDLVPVAETHRCCGSAGSYAALQPVLASALRERKLSTLLAEGPDVIATANVGCQMHLAARSDVPVVHWLELVGGANVQFEGEG